MIARFLPPMIARCLPLWQNLSLEMELGAQETCCWHAWTSSAKSSIQQRVLNFARLLKSNQFRFFL